MYIYIVVGAVPLAKASGEVEVHSTPSRGKKGGGGGIVAVSNALSELLVVVSVINCQTIRAVIQ